MTATDDEGDDEETATLKAAAGKLLTESAGVAPPHIVYHYTSFDTAFVRPDGPGSGLRSSVSYVMVAVIH